jgi:hypothetical protein
MLTPDDLPSAFWEMLRAFGMPEEITYFRAEMAQGKPITITVEFYPTDDEGRLKTIDDKLEKASKRYKLVEVGHDDELPPTHVHVEGQDDQF